MFYGTYKLMMNRYPSNARINTLNADSGAHPNRIGRQRARSALLAKSDRLLADMGFSRERLNQGVNAWPWRAEPETTGDSTGSVVVLATQRPNVVAVQHPDMIEQRQAA